MQEARAFFQPLLEASHHPEPEERTWLLRSLAAALSGQRLPSVPRPLPVLPRLLRALPPPRPGPATRPGPTPGVTVFLPVGSDMPLGGEWLSLPVVLADGRWFMLEGWVLSAVAGRSRCGQLGWHVRVSPEAD